MARSEDLIDFDVIENQKENIQSLPGGRSAKALFAVFSSGPGSKVSSPGLNDTNTLNDAIRQEYEIELESITESDDPLDIYDRYVKWTLNAYPSAQATSQSGLLPLLERATKAFLSSNDYKNDPRYLRLWLHYIRLFSDAPRETFAFLARHGIGENLALFYEEFAAWLEGAGRYAQAEEVYKLGLQCEARPAERLLRKFGEFQIRLEQRPRSSNGPSSPALPKVRLALAAKIDPFASAVSTSPTPEPQAPRQRSGNGSGQTSRSGKTKMAIFSDIGAEEKPPTGPQTKGWESIGAIRDRKKENTMEPKPWAGETLKSGKRPGKVEKMAVFKDEKQSRVSESIIPKNIPHNEKETVNPRTGKIERVFVNLEAIYPDRNNPSHEMSLEELRAASRGWLGKDWSQHRQQPLKEISGNGACKDLTAQQKGVDSVDNALSSNLQEKLKIEEDQAPSSEERMEAVEVNREVKGGKTKRLKVREIKGETQTVKTNLESPTGRKIKRKNTSEPTMTLHTRAATDEIYNLFNQPLKSEMDVGDAESVYDSEYDDDYTSACESIATGRISGTTSEFGDDETTGFRKAREDDVEEEYDNETRADSADVGEWTEFSASRHVPNLYPEGKDGTNNTTGPINNTTMSSRFNIPEDQYDGASSASHPEDISFPSSPRPEDDDLKHKFVPIPPEDYNPPSGLYRDPDIMAQNRLPFMTPIVERTESSFSSTAFQNKKYTNTKTPSKKTRSLVSATPTIPEIDDLLLSSPFQDFSQVNDREAGYLPDEGSPSRLAKKLKPSPKKSIPSRHAPSKEKIIINEQQCNPIDPVIKQKILDHIYPPLQTYNGYHDHSSQTSGHATGIRKYIKQLAKTSKTPGPEKSLPVQPVLSFSGASRSYAIQRELGEGGFAPVYLAESVDSPDTLTSDSEMEAVSNGSNKRRLGSNSYSPSKAPRDCVRKALEAIKVETDEGSAWEFYMIRTAHARLGSSITHSRAKDSIVRAHEMHLFKDEGFLIEDYRSQGTLVDLVNAVRNEANSLATTPEPGLDEAAAMFFTVELFRTVEALHACGILHGDIKADNCLVRLDNDSPARTVSLIDDDLDMGAYPTHYSPTGTHSWRNKGIALIDFGRAVDMHAFPEDVQFFADWKVGSHECSEMREFRPWTYQVDLYGLAGTVYNLLFGKYIEVISGSSENGHGSKNSSPARGINVGSRKSYRIKESLKRYWEREIWAEVFDLCLNPCSEKWANIERQNSTTTTTTTAAAATTETTSSENDTGLGAANASNTSNNTLPVLHSMKYVREKMEAWLLANAERKALQSQLRKLESLVAKKR
ncbi:BUB protein kinase [Polytolypa hystricis UAMH7299]|uniref:BUB protein kinase n=1 Tax=Polytolypa hystricis (strain UAMH7299) TaxID=1447883 RepID=A0A2B7YCI0_POLH7|nr:BUB protein kinase [Polytolypa hystricis UAMH7299]